MTLPQFGHFLECLGLAIVVYVGVMSRHGRGVVPHDVLNDGGGHAGLLKEAGRGVSESVKADFVGLPFRSVSFARSLFGPFPGESCADENFVELVAVVSTLFTERQNSTLFRRYDQCNFGGF